MVRASTLRVLLMMFEGRQRAAYDVAIDQVRFINQIFGTEGFDPIKANPYRQGEQKNIEDLKTPEMKEMENKLALKALGRALAQMCPPKSPAAPKKNVRPKMG